jgi:hypothetical protein
MDAVEIRSESRNVKCAFGCWRQGKPGAVEALALDNRMQNKDADSLIHVLWYAGELGYVAKLNVERDMTFLAITVTQCSFIHAPKHRAHHVTDLTLAPHPARLETPMASDDQRSPRTSPVPSTLRRRLTSAQSSSLSSLRSRTTQSS